MKKVIVIIVLLCGFACGETFAQDTLRVDPPKVAQSLLEKLNHELTLTTEQQEKVYALLLERSEQFAKIRDANKGKDLSKSSFRVPNQQATDKLKQVLTTEQHQKMKALRLEEQRQKAVYKEEELYKSLQDIEIDF